MASRPSRSKRPTRRPRRAPRARSRSEQREATRERIVEAALEAFAERGFHGASTRDIAQRAGTNQGLITYHFRSKDELWRAAADRIFGMLVTSLGKRMAALRSDDPRERAREAIREYVRFAAAHPELFRLMVDEGKNPDERMLWLVDTHLKPRYAAFRDPANAAVAALDPSLHPHAWYVMAGAASLIFAVAPECRRLTGLDPGRPQAVERHADFVARLLLP
jgi:TetR/AcrR family transcriptional regulator